MKRLIKYSIASIVLVILIIFYANYRVTSTTEAQLYDNTNDIPYNKVGLVLGTAKNLKSGIENHYFTYRIQAVVKLYKAGKIDFIVVSGDNSTKGYNEPEDMEASLIEHGIPKDKIYLDYAGFRTLDSVYRMEAIFGQKTFTIISQPFHNERAVYIANNLELNTVAYNAKDVNKRYGFKTMLREKLARVKVILDNTFAKKPKFLGTPIEIGEGKLQDKA